MSAKNIIKKINGKIQKNIIKNIIIKTFILLIFIAENNQTKMAIDEKYIIFLNTSIQIAHPSDSRLLYFLVTIFSFFIKSFDVFFCNSIDAAKKDKPNM